MYLSRDGSNASIAGVYGQKSRSVTSLFTVGEAATSTNLRALYGVLPLTSGGAGSGFFFSSFEAVFGSVGFVNDRGIVSLSVAVTRPAHMAWLNEAAGTLLVTSPDSGTVFLLTPMSATSTPSTTTSPSQTTSSTPSPSRTPSMTTSPSLTPNFIPSSTPSVTLSQISTYTQSASPGATATGIRDGFNVTTAASDAYGAFDASADGIGGFFVTSYSSCVVYHLSSVGATKVVVAGTFGSCISAGADGSPSLSAGLNQPTGIAAFSPTDFLVAEYGGHCVRRSTNGLIYTVAGTGSGSNSGDGGLAINAGVYRPLMVRLDDARTGFYITQSDRVRRVLLAGIISTVASEGSYFTCASPDGAGGL